MNDFPYSAPRPTWLDDDEEEDDAPARPTGASKGDSNLIERRMLEARTLMITGPVTDKMAAYCSSRLMVLEQMDAEKPITVLINSPGGSADSGFAMYDIMKFVTPPIRTIVNGLCASAAILVFLAGRKGQRFAMPNSRFLIHQPSTAGRGTASDLDITAREILKLRDAYNKIIGESTGHKMDKVLEDARRDFWLSAAEALEYKLVDRIIQHRQELED